VRYRAIRALHYAAHTPVSFLAFAREVQPPTSRLGGEPTQIRFRASLSHLGRIHVRPIRKNQFTLMHSSTSHTDGLPKLLRYWWAPEAFWQSATRPIVGGNDARAPETLAPHPQEFDRLCAELMSFPENHSRKRSLAMKMFRFVLPARRSLGPHLC